MSLQDNSVDFLNVLISYVLPLLFSLLSIVVTAWLGAATWSAVKRFFKEVRGLVDEPDDPLILAIDGVGEFVLHRQLDEKLISQLMTAVADAIANTPDPTS